MSYLYENSSALLPFEFYGTRTQFRDMCYLKYAQKLLLIDFRFEKSFPNVLRNVLNDCLCFFAGHILIIGVKVTFFLVSDLFLTTNNAWQPKTFGQDWPRRVVAKCLFVDEKLAINIINENVG